MDCNFITTPFAATAATMFLLAASLLSAATAEEIGGQSTPRESGQGAWSLLRDDHVAGQKSAEIQVTSRREAPVFRELLRAPASSTERNLARPASGPPIKTTQPSGSDLEATGPRWINVSDTDATDTDANQVASSGTVANSPESQERAAASQTPTPREMTLANAQPLALRPTRQPGRRDVRGEVMRSLLTLREPPQIESLANPGSGDRQSAKSSGAPTQSFPAFDVPSSSTSLAIAPSQPALQVAAGALDTGRTPTPSRTDLQSPKQPPLETSTLLSLPTPHRAGPLAASEDLPTRSSQLTARQEVCIKLDTATLHHLRVQDPIARIEVGDESVCGAFRLTDRELDLIAKQNGKTLVTIHFTTDRKPEVYAVRVGSLTEPECDLASDLPLQTLVAEMFPDSNVLFTSTDNKLVVSGTSRSDAEAIRLISFVRSLRLVPVVDQVKVQR
ncbi:MAG: pilus assembly protein N-terminal domain-containing protein [Planctomycetia bacterium]|nr:pilus assembly protein N-terminal domain-containing protein [Planctomycetia bacterium]